MIFGHDIQDTLQHQDDAVRHQVPDHRHQELDQADRGVHQANQQKDKDQARLFPSTRCQCRRGVRRVLLQVLIRQQVD